MKIIEVKAIPLSIALKKNSTISSGSMSSMASAKASSIHILVKIQTDEGITGYGEAFRFTPSVVCKFIEEALRPLIIGKDPLHIAQLWNLMYQATFRYGRKGIAIQCISGIEIALWDILGKYRNLPVYEMLGGLSRDQAKAYASMLRYNSPEDAARVALGFVEEGYTAIKLHQTDPGYVKAVRELIPEDVDLMLDVNGFWSPRETIIKTKELEEYRLLWLEEPVLPMDDYEGLAYVTANSNIRIAAGENEYTRYGFKEMVTKRAVDILQPDVIKAGGILECRKILTLAEAWNLQLIPHSFCFGPGIAATLHFSLSNMSSEYIEVNAVPLELPYIEPSLRPEGGYLKASGKPGLGIEIDEDVVKSHPYTG
jgi:L-alanine-DL-glutamate epimerase-like enolase superfamily enzyme